MHTKKSYRLILIILCATLFLSSCAQPNLQWRSGKLVAQLYRQYKQELLLAYDDFHAGQIVDVQEGYARAYFDPYRKQMIFTPQWSLNYLIDGQPMTTATDEISGYVYNVLISENYQIGVESFALAYDIELDEINSKTRIIDLNTQKGVTILGLPSDTILMGNYVYCVSQDEDFNEFLDIINVKTWEQERISIPNDLINLFYQMGDKHYVQTRFMKKTFLLEDGKMIEQDNLIYNEYPIIDGGSGATVLKNIAPLDSSEHWYLNPLKEYDVVTQAEVLRFSESRVERTLIDFKRDDILQIIDVANFGVNRIALMYAVRVEETGDTREFIVVYDLSGNEIETVELTELYDNRPGRLMYLDYVV